MNLSTGNGIRIARGLAAIFAALAFALVAMAQAVTTTTVQGTVYFANGQPGSGTVQIQWLSFTTAGGQAIAAGSTTATIGSDGFLSVNLAPNQDATPAGLFYTVTYYLSNGATNTEYWVVPDAASATLAQVRSTVMPSSQAIQTVSKAYVDQAIANISQGGLSPTGGTLTGPLYLAGDPTASLQAADKHYVDTSVAQTVPLSGATLTGALIGPSVNASVNNVINVMAPPYNAKGDCSTDDHNAIQAALSAAQANPSSNTVVYFPTPPGGCYLTSQLNWYGVSLRGEAGNNQNGQTWQGVTLKGKPGQDILHTGDPDSTATVPTRLWSIENIRFLLDDSIDASGSSGSFAHRWPGKWVGDGAMTSGSATLTSTYAEFTCGDIGQAVLVKGAGAGGADLSTTISSVSPCYTSVAPTSVTLAASASTTVSAARAYIAVAGMPVAQQIGNCAIAMDNSDGNSANWQGLAPTRLPLYDNLHNVNFSTTSGAMQGQNNSCAIYLQGVYTPYGIDARNVNVTRFTYGVVEGLSDVNPAGASGNNVGVGQDYQLWDHGDWVSKYPWISYNGGENEMKGIQLYAAAGPQLLQIKSVTENGGSRWKIEAPEFEQPSGAVSGWRIDLDLNTLINTQLASSAANIPASINGFGNRCIACLGPQTLDLGGYNNDIQMTYGPATVNDSGYGNTVYTMNNTAAYAGQTPTRPVAQNATRGVEPWGRLSADFIRSGNASTPYMNLEDLLILPADVRWTSGVGTVVFPDASSITGKYGLTNGVDTVLGFANAVASALTGNTYNYAIGGVGAGNANVPATKITLYASVKCPVVTSYTLTVRAGSTTVATATPTCNSSGYTVGSVTADLSSYAGQDFGFAIGSGSGEVDWGYVAVRPFQADYNGYQPLNRAGDTMTGPLTLNADPTTSLGAATKNYVDTHSGGVTSIDSQTGAFTFGGPGVSHVANAYTFSGGSSAATIYAPVSYYAFGDSITAGVNVTNAQNRYANRLAAFAGIPTGTFAAGGFVNSAAGGETTCGILDTQILPNYAPSLAQQEPLISVLAGKNDQTDGATYANSTFSLCYGAGLSWMAIPSQSKVMASAATSAGTCAADNTYAKAPGVDCTASGSTITFSGASAITTTGKPIYVWYRIINSDAGTFTYSLDGGGAVSVTTAPSVAMHTTDGTTQSLGYIRISSVSAGTHSLVFTMTSSTGNMAVIGIGTPSTALAPSAPYVLSLQNTPEQDGANAALVLAFQTATDAVDTQLSGDGLNIIEAFPKNYLIATTAAADINGVHPNDAGDGEVFASVIAAMPGLRPGAGQGSAPFYYCVAPSPCAVNGNQVIIVNGGTGFTMPTEPQGTIYLVNNFTSSPVTLSGLGTPASIILQSHQGVTLASTNPAWEAAAIPTGIPTVVSLNGGSYAASSLPAYNGANAIVFNYSTTANLTLTGIQPAVGGTIIIPPLSGIQLSRPGNGNWYQTSMGGATFAGQWNTPTYTAATGCTAPAPVAGITNTNARGEVSIACTSATTGTIGTINLYQVGNGSSASPMGAQMCMVSENGGAHGLGWGPFAYTSGPTQSFPITASVSVASSTVTVDYRCLP